MPDVNRPLGHIRPLAMAGLLGLVACSSPDSASSGDAPSPATPAASAPPPTTPASGEPVSSSPGSESIDPSIPTSLASASAVARATWRALEAVDAGDAEAMSLVMTSDARWFPPGSVEESVDNQPGTMASAMAPWSGPDVELSVRRVIEPGYGPVVVQLAVDRVSSPGAGNELVLLIKHLLYDQKYTINGARRHLKQTRRSAEMAEERKQVVTPSLMEEIRTELDGLLEILTPAASGGSSNG